MAVLFKDPVGTVVNKEIDVWFERFHIWERREEIGELCSVIPDLDSRTKCAPFFQVSFEVFAFFLDGAAEVALNGT